MTENRQRPRIGFFGRVFYALHWIDERKTACVLVSGISIVITLLLCYAGHLKNGDSIWEASYGMWRSYALEQSLSELRDQDDLNNVLLAGLVLAPLATMSAVLVFLFHLAHDNLERAVVRKWRNHSVVFTLDEHGRRLCLQLKREGATCVMVVDPEPSKGNAAFCRRHRIFYVPCEATLMSRPDWAFEIIREGSLDNAMEIFLLGEKDDLNAHMLLILVDGLEPATRTRRVDSIRIICHLSSREVRGRVLRHPALQPHLFHGENALSPLQIRVFSHNENAVYQLFSRLPVPGHYWLPPARSFFTPEDTGPAALQGFIIGFGHTGKLLLEHLLVLAHVSPPSTAEWTPATKNRFVVVDPKLNIPGENHVEPYSFLESELEWSQLSRVSDLDIIDQAADSPGTFQSIWNFMCESDRSYHNVCFVSTGEDARNIEVGLELGRRLRKRMRGSTDKTCPSDVWIFIRVRNQTGLFHALREEKEATPPSTAPQVRIVPYGSTDDTARPGEIYRDSHLELAWNLHTAHLQTATEVCRPLHEPVHIHSAEELHKKVEWTTERNIQASMHAFVKLGILRQRFNAEELKELLLSWLEPSSKETRGDDMFALLTRLEHHRWNMEKLLRGYAPAKAAESNLPAHPCLVPFEDLDDEAVRMDEGQIKAVAGFFTRTETGRTFLDETLNP